MLPYHPARDGYPSMLEAADAAGSAIGADGPATSRLYIDLQAGLRRGRSRASSLRSPEPLLRAQPSGNPNG